MAAGGEMGPGHEQLTVDPAKLFREAALELEQALHDLVGGIICPDGQEAAAGPDGMQGGYGDDMGMGADPEEENFEGTRLKTGVRKAVKYFPQRLDTIWRLQMEIDFPV
jgi:hypothetical protein